MSEGFKVIEEIGTRVWRDLQETFLEGLRPPPGVLYHYTDAAGLLGITERSELWATHHAFVNDPTEGRQFPELVQQAAGVLAVGSGSGCTDLQRYFFGNMAGSGGYQLGTTWYLTSFSEDPDNLTQWRLYAADGAGFSLGLLSERLASLSTPASSLSALMPVVYDREQQMELATSIAAQISGAVEKVGEELPAIRERRNWRDLLRYGALYARALAEQRFAALFKSQAYEHEREWRLVHQGVDPMAVHEELVGLAQSLGKFEPMKFRTSGNTIIPYLPVGIPDLASTLLEIRMGPRQNPERARISLQGLRAARRLAWRLPIIESTHRYGGR